jgi:raffinose/stachyose/melibiose transport system substrate-binding protein
MWEFNEFLERYGWSENISSILSGKKKFNNSDMQKAFDKIKGLADADAFPENLSTIEYFDAKQQFDDKKAAMFGTGQWDATEFDQNIGKDIGFWWGPKFQDSKYEQNVSMKVPSAPIVVAKTVEDNDAQKKAVYAFLKYYYGKDAAKLSYAKSAFPATSYTGFKAADDQYSMNAMIAALDKGWKSPSSAPDLSVPSSVQQVLYNSIFGVIQKNYSPTEALNKLDQSLSY